MVVLRNLRIWDGVAESYLDADSIRIDGEQIASVEHGGDARDAIDMHGVTALPGLIDAHVHLCLDPEEKDPLAHGLQTDDAIMAQMKTRAAAMVKAGITTARDLGGGRWLELALRDQIERGDVVGPRLLCAGQPITIPDGHCYFWGGGASSLEEVLAVLSRQLEHGADLIKVMATGGSITPKSRPVDSQFDLHTLTAIKREASVHGRHVAAHCHGTCGIRDAATAGIDTIEHCSWVGEAGWGSDFDEEAARLIAESDIRVSPTVSLGWKRRLETAWGTQMKDNFAAMKKAGVKFIASTDAGIPGVHHPDLAKALPVFATYVDLSPLEALMAATSESARAIGLGRVTGRLEAGMAADIMIVEGDPLADLAVLEHPINVFSRGRPVLREI